MLPTTTATASHGLFDESRLALSLPSANATEKDGVVLVWGGASSVGMCAIQLLKTAGYSIITTASPTNFGILQDLGDKNLITVVDYNSTNVVSDIVSAVKSSNKKMVGAFDCISTSGPEGTVQKCISALRETMSPTERRIVASTKGAAEAESSQDEAIFVRSMFTGKNWENEEASKVWKIVEQELLPKGWMRAKPDAEIFGEGLERIQCAMDAVFAGKVRAKKAVVTFAL